jgi:hypothetical protein
MGVDRKALPSLQNSRKATGVVGMGVTQRDRGEGLDLDARTLEIVEQNRGTGPGVEQEPLPIVGLDEKRQAMLAPER